jgi:hypothetical protein
MRKKRLYTNADKKETSESEAHQTCHRRSSESYNHIAITETHHQVVRAQRFAQTHTDTRKNRQQLQMKSHTSPPSLARPPRSSGPLEKRSSLLSSSLAVGNYPWFFVCPTAAPEPEETQTYAKQWNFWQTKQAGPLNQWLCRHIQDGIITKMEHSHKENVKSKLNKSTRWDPDQW